MKLMISLLAILFSLSAIATLGPNRTVMGVVTKWDADFVTVISENHTLSIDKSILPSKYTKLRPGMLVEVPMTKKQLAAVKFKKN